VKEKKRTLDRNRGILNYTNTAKNISINTFFINAVSDRLAKWFHIEPAGLFTSTNGLPLASLQY
jgi:hypothetical protein